jgi:hypothetical protein
MRISGKGASVVAMAALLVGGLMAWPGPAMSLEAAGDSAAVLVLAQKGKNPQAGNPASQSAGAPGQAVAQSAKGKGPDGPPGPPPGVNPGPPPGLPPGPPFDPPGPPPVKPPVSPHR